MFVLQSPPLAAQDVPANYTSSGNTSIVFPRVPPPQYIMVDMGNWNIVDMNDSGQLLVTDSTNGTAGLWTGGVVANIDTSDDDDTYTWLSVTNNGTVLGTYVNGDYTDAGFVFWS
ncbi:MAG TPA: hypothetical protein VK737_03120, partial [Opitutales bacterium]|nr:hypothetical protein [Opitutales bacterium]